MKNFTRNAIATLSLVLLTQTISAGYTKNSETLDVKKFSSVWQELHRGEQVNKKTLTSSIENLLESETLDIEKFSSVWHQLNRNETTDQKRLISTMENLLNNSVQIKDEECIPTIDIAKFSPLWQEINTNNNRELHLSNALNSTLNEVTCTLS
ncbi:MAG: Unknown protein [uncultured Sulfurovum sp.]|uniref:Uncharacterized protein n=1 Tax=uncultured Sulfurovum sp. TaxID=269237 RepID=A0A6S6SKQ7_9BACT|nr:MAG: Unknown protein [uncultured Sulfurovum sp.]